MYCTEQYTVQCRVQCRGWGPSSAEHLGIPAGAGDPGGARLAAKSSGAASADTPFVITYVDITLRVPVAVQTALVTSFRRTSLAVLVPVRTVLVITCADITHIASVDRTCAITYVDISPASASADSTYIVTYADMTCIITYADITPRVPVAVRTSVVSSLMPTSFPVPVPVRTALVITYADITPIASADSTCSITYVHISPIKSASASARADTTCIITYADIIPECQWLCGQQLCHHLCGQHSQIQCQYGQHLYHQIDAANS